ncbi:MAG: hypothetical protein LE168_01940, partial [Endomicrobium sp.]|nr:hypothetical protein [Endomicrobium sp.]
VPVSFAGTNLKDIQQERNISPLNHSNVLGETSVKSNLKDSSPKILENKSLKAYDFNNAYGLSANVPASNQSRFTLNPHALSFTGHIKGQQEEESGNTNFCTEKEDLDRAVENAKVGYSVAKEDEELKQKYFYKTMEEDSGFLKRLEEAKENLSEKQRLHDYHLNGDTLFKRNEVEAEERVKNAEKSFIDSKTTIYRQNERNKAFKSLKDAIEKFGVAWKPFDDSLNETQRRLWESLNETKKKYDDDWKSFMDSLNYNKYFGSYYDWTKKKYFENLNGIDSRTENGKKLFKDSINKCRSELRFEVGTQCMSCEWDKWDVYKSDCIPMKSFLDSLNEETQRRLWESLNETKRKSDGNWEFFMNSLNETQRRLWESMYEARENLNSARESLEEVLNEEELKLLNNLYDVWSKKIDATKALHDDRYLYKKELDEAQKEFDDVIKNMPPKQKATYNALLLSQGFLDEKREMLGKTLKKRDEYNRQNVIRLQNCGRTNNAVGGNAAGDFGDESRLFR